MTTPIPHLAPGLWGVLATPFSGTDFAVDTDSLRREVQLYTALPATGMVVLGVFGEGASLDAQEQALIVRTVAEEGKGAPLVVGLSARSTAVALGQARTAVKAAGSNLAALMVQANSSDPEVLAAHLTAVHRATGAGIVLQDYPVASGVNISAAQILEVLAQCPFIVAIKSEAPPTASAIARLTGATSVPVYGGLGGVGLLDELAAGAAGAMTGFSHPEGLQAALSAWADGGFRAAREAFAPWLPLVNFEAQPGVGLALRKEVLRRRGIIAESIVRPPAPKLPPALADLIDAHLEAVRVVMA
ncbi:dihydrodipicolinate synthase family protein [Pseudarthrobacter raffinosi]|uniref:dihydrodipicolinate synthase family protein n=1 Tax=Pseudarthrobacter raffinosi TaxID=2953651 RepID=UPI00208EB45C|nr:MULTISPECIES: dihydrodipicolinate synthase family protein [unclassified Pseudarthrobacter]MCO4252688.1 dihydrodipicolinate synthase family protein [Pseudarthrobacter sp. MDT3-9]MCO4264428.1 dihydrodipicolinate synthase family protein [Pseudarthrobacter sp. MDT3-26]